MKKILAPGATGQIGTELVPAQRQRYGADNVIAAGHRKTPQDSLLRAAPFSRLMCLIEQPWRR